jgi:hypothetical protein
VETSSDVVDIQTEYDTGRGVLFADVDPLVAYMDANNGTDALLAVYSLDEYTLLTVVCYAVRYVIDIRRR